MVTSVVAVLVPPEALSPEATKVVGAPRATVILDPPFMLICGSPLATKTLGEEAARVRSPGGVCIAVHRHRHLAFAANRHVTWY